MTATPAAADPLPLAPGHDAPARPHRLLPLAALLGICLLINILCLPSRTFPGDPILCREEARSLLLAGRLWVGPEIIARASDPGQYFVLNPRDGHWYSKYGIMNSLAWVPPLLAERVTTGILPGLDSPTRIRFLNAWETLLATVTAAVLYRVARLYTDRRWVAVAWVLLCCYATSMWFYLRAQGGEVLQVLFFAAFFDQFVRHLRDDPGGPRSRRHLLTALTWAGALCLTKVSYVLLLPLAAAWSAWHLMRSPARATWPRWALVVIPPIVFIAGIIATLNFVRFGSPLLTGYHQWHPEDHRPGATPWVGVIGFLVAPQQSILTHFPVLLLALAGTAAFFRRHRREALFLLAAFLVFLVAIGSLPSWAGGWSYGPRYLLFILPVLSVPSVYALEWIATRPVAFPRLLAAAACAVAFAISVFFQLQVNALDFFTFYQVKAVVEAHPDVPLPRYFSDRHFGRIYHDLRRFADDPARQPGFLDELRGQLDPGTLADVARQTRERSSKGNYYWFSPPESAPRMVGSRPGGS